MGIDTHSLNLLRYARARHGGLGDTLTLGRLAVLLGPKAMQAWTGQRSGAYCETMLTNHFGATHVDSIDNSAYEGASILADMNQPVPQALANRYDTILDFGCTEHIFDVAQSFRNITRMCKPGGHLLHVVPSDGFCGHGFYQFTPEFFFSRYSRANGYAGTEVFLADLLDTRHWYRVTPPTDGKRINLRTTGETYVIAMTTWTGNGADQAQQSDYEFTWAGASTTPAPPHSPGEWAWLREILEQNRLLAHWVGRVDAMLAANGARLPHRHPALAKTRINSLLRTS